MKFPLEQHDRRRHRHAPARAGKRTRRAAPRYLAAFPVTIHVGSGSAERVYRARAWDISDGGLALENIDIPDREARISLDFDIPPGTMPEEYVRGRYHVEGRVAHRGNERMGVAFRQPLSRRLAKGLWPGLRSLSVMALFLAVSFILLIKYQNIYYFWFDVPVFLYGLAVGAYLLSRFVFAAFYRPPEARDDSPAVSIVIPALNEEGEIRRTLEHALESDYPADKLQVIAVNDGSDDRTLEVMHEVRERYPELVVIDFGERRGKRHALAAGTKLATGEVLVFVDSDSVVHPDAVRRIVDGFAEPDVAAVCGHCEVENQWTNLLTRMQAVRYYIGFRVMKGAESIFDSVTCLSGPLAAYRREALMPVLDDWVRQTFLGRPATYGDDRSLTNFLLKDYKIRYDSRARTRTIVPEQYGTFLRQQMRWKRSWFRESVRAAGFMWRKEPLMWLSFYLGLILPILGPAIVFRAMLYVPLFQHGTPFMYMFGILLMSVLMSSVYLFAKRSRLWAYGIPFCFFYMFVLVWQLPVAILSFWVPRWGTRG
ncbi:MAG TPA: glycosyltransferase [Arenicellales bacterium]|nr:glycosyltransferase [Arenicellales bacterium]